jgi:hypothetical protein
MGLVDGTPGGSRHACSSAYLGLAGSSGRGLATARTRAELGRTSACSSVATATCRCTGSCLGWVSRARTLGGAARTRSAARATSRTSTGGGAFMERARGSPSAVVGRPGRFTAVPDPDGSIVEPAGSGLERPSAVRLDTGRARIYGLGCTAARGARATTDRCTFLERPGPRGLGRAEDRRARSSCRAVMVGAGRVTGRPGRSTATVELALAPGSTHTRSLVATRAGTCSARSQLQRGGARRGSRGGAA